MVDAHLKKTDWYWRNKKPDHRGTNRDWRYPVLSCCKHQ